MNLLIFNSFITSRRPRQGYFISYKYLKKVLKLAKINLYIGNYRFGSRAES